MTARRERRAEPDGQQRYPTQLAITDAGRGYLAEMRALP